MHVALSTLLLGSMAPSVSPATPSVLPDAGSGETTSVPGDDVDDAASIDVLNESEAEDVFAVRPTEGFVGVELSRAGDEKDEDLELEVTATRSDESDAETEYTLAFEYVFAGRWILALENTHQRGEASELMLGVARALY